jgi:molybdate transport repressor ModE-like protein
MSLDLVSLRLLVLIDDTGSLGAAARDLGISQPAASARLRSLETHVGLSLVLRSTRGSRLTDDGRAVCAWARLVMEDVAHLETGVAALTAQRRGNLKIAASLTIAEYLMPRWLAELQRAQADVHAGLVVINSHDVVEQVRAGVVTVGFIESPLLTPDLRSQLVGTDRISVVVRPDHPWASSRRPISGQTLAATPLVVRESGSGTRETFDRALGQVGMIAMEAGSPTAIIGAVLNGVGPGVVSEIAVRTAIVQGMLVDVPVALDLRRALRAIWRRSERLHSPTSDLISIAARSSPDEP